MWLMVMMVIRTEMENDGGIVRTSFLIKSFIHFHVVFVIFPANHLFRSGLFTSFFSLSSHLSTFFFMYLFIYLLV